MALGISRRRSNFVVPKLMITSMMDMFTIILIFLLFSFSSDPEKLQLDKDIDLPESSAETNYNDSIKLILTKNTLKLGDDVLAQIVNGEIEGIDAQDPRKSFLFQRLQELRLEEEKKAAETESAVSVDTAEIKDANADGKVKNQILFLCDKGHSFKTINSIMKAAGHAGYPNFQFAVLKE
jgi:biopolymer transport protein ExbD